METPDCCADFTSAKSADVRCEKVQTTVATFSCDVDGKHTEITIPADAWDFENKTVWLTQAQLAELYKTSVQNVGHHIGNILEDEELQADSTIKEFFIVQTEGNREVSRQVTHYNLEMLIALGYRIRSKVATKFRQWATQHLKELMTKGHTETQPQLDLSKLTRREILQMALDAEIAKEEAEKKLALSSQELDTEKEDHRHDNCVKNGRAGGLTKNRNFHQARADAAEARAYEAETKTEEQAKTIDELKERLMNELEDWKTARDFCEPTRFSFYDYTLKYRISEDLVRVSAILHITWKRGEYSRQFRKQAFDVLLHHFCCDPTYLKEWRYDWHEDMYKYGALSRECGDKLEGTPDILEGLV